MSEGSQKKRRPAGRSRPTSKSPRRSTRKASAGKVSSGKASSGKPTSGKAGAGSAARSSSRPRGRGKSGRSRGAAGRKSSGLSLAAIQVALVGVIIVLVLLSLVALIVIRPQAASVTRNGIEPPGTHSAASAAGEAPEKSDSQSAFGPSVPTGSSGTSGSSDTSAATGSASSSGSGTSSAPNGSNGVNPGSDSTTTPTVYRPEQETKDALYLVIDDVGYNLFQLQPFLHFPGMLTIAVLPKLEYSRDAAELAAQAGKQVILHLPMEAMDGQNPGPGTITVGMDDGEIERQFAADLGTVPGAIGVNNHEGSRATSDARVMRVVLTQIADRGLFFLDSRTTAATVAPQSAESLGVPFAERQVFLDDTDSKDAILSQLYEARKLAAERGSVVMIGHVFSKHLLEALDEMYPRLIADGFHFGKLSDAVHLTRPGLAGVR